LNSGLKGHRMSAQGKRPGLAIQQKPNALKGQSTNLLCPFRAMFGCVQRTWGGVHPHSRIHLPQADMLGPVRAKRGFSGLKDHDMSAHRHATVCHGVNVTLLLPTPVIERGIVSFGDENI